MFRAENICLTRIGLLPIGSITRGAHKGRAQPYGRDTQDNISGNTQNGKPDFPGIHQGQSFVTESGKGSDRAQNSDGQKHPRMLGKQAVMLNQMHDYAKNKTAEDVYNQCPGWKG